MSVSSAHIYNNIEGNSFPSNLIQCSQPSHLSSILNHVFLSCFRFPPSTCYYLDYWNVFSLWFSLPTLHKNSFVLQEYIPTEKDILHCRKATKAITEFTIPIQNVPFLFVDVGGQRTQRQKWFQCFESVTSIIFLASSSEFDQRLLEDRYSRIFFNFHTIYLGQIFIVLFMTLSLHDEDPCLLICLIAPIHIA